MQLVKFVHIHVYIFLENYILILFNSGETQKLIFRNVFTHFLKNNKVDEVGEE